MRLATTLTTLLLLTATAAVAKNEPLEIRVIGVGQTYEMALQSAFDEAVRQAFGAYVFVQTESKDEQLSSKKVVTSSQGYVQAHEVLSQEKTDLGVQVEVAVTIADQALRDLVVEKGLSSWDGEIQKTAAIEHTQEKLRRGRDLLVAMVGDPAQVIERGYSFRKIGYEIEDVGVDAIRGNFLVRVDRNPLFWANYWDLIQTLSDDGERSIQEGLYGCDSFDEGGRNTYLPPPPRFIHDFLRIKTNLSPAPGSRGLYPLTVHQSLAPYLAAPLKTGLSIGESHVEIVLHKNALLAGNPDISQDARGLSYYFATPNYLWTEKNRWLVGGSADGAVYLRANGYEHKLSWAEFVRSQKQLGPEHASGLRLDYPEDMPLLSTKSTNFVKVPFVAQSSDALKEQSLEPLGIRIIKTSPSEY